LVSIGKTEEGRAHWMMIVSSPENYDSLEKFKDSSLKMARAEGLLEDEARACSPKEKLSSE
jgi:hypothetical protein